MPQVVTCPRCERTLIAGDRFCGNCGHDITGGGGGPPAAGKSDALRDALVKATLGDYDVRGELGRGGMAVVYLAHEIALDRKVAIKVLSPALMMMPGMGKRFLREAQTAAKLEHPHIIPIFAVKETDDLVFFTMRWVAGLPLSTIIKRVGPLPIQLVRGLLADVGGALAVAHERGVLHRDVKPGNVLIGRDGSVIVTDFGIAKNSDGQGLTMTGQLLGTPGYMSPEQCRGGDVSPAADQYSLGAMAFELLAGRPPFLGNNPMEVMARQMSEAVPKLTGLRSDCPRDLANAVTRMLAKDPNRRFADMAEALDAGGAVSLPQHDPLRAQLIKWAEGGASQEGQSVTPISPAMEIKKRRSGPKQQPPVPPPAPTQVAEPTGPARSIAWRPIIIGACALVALLATGAIFWALFHKESGRLVVTGLPPGATVRVDGGSFGPNGEVPVGRREVRIEAPGYQPTVDVLTIAAGRSDTLPFHAAPVPPPVTTGTLVVTQLPADGIVRIDGNRVRGRRFPVDPGQHTVRLELAGYESTEVEVVLEAGRSDTVAFAGVALAVEPPKPEPLKPELAKPGPAKVDPPKPRGSGTLMLRVKPFARVSIDGRFAVEDEVLVRTLPAGQHRLRFEKDGFEARDTTITISASDTVKVRIALQRKPY